MVGSTRFTYPRLPPGLEGSGGQGNRVLRSLQQRPFGGGGILLLVGEAAAGWSRSRTLGCVRPLGGRRVRLLARLCGGASPSPSWGLRGLIKPVASCSGGLCDQIGRRSSPHHLSLGPSHRVCGLPWRASVVGWWPSEVCHSYFQILFDFRQPGVGLGYQPAMLGYLLWAFVLSEGVLALPDAALGEPLHAGGAGDSL